TFASVASGSREAGTPQRFSLIPFRSRLVAGDNVLALVGLNSSTASSDLSLAHALGTIPLVVHAGFELRGDGEYLALTTPRGEPVDEVHVPVQTQDHSYGRSPDGDGPWHYLLTPTPEAPNRTRTSPTPYASEVTFDPPAGKHPRALQVSIAAEPRDQVEVRYTTDGSAPTPASVLYQGPIPVSRNTVLRAAGFIGAERSTRVLSRSYFVGGALALPILSISMEPADYERVHNDSQASGRTSERACYLEIFEPGGEPCRATGCGLRLHGGAGRSGDLNTKKAYKLYFRRAYGDPRLEYPIIPDTAVAEFDKLVLRSGFNDCFRTGGAAAYIRDQLIRDLHRDMGAIASHGSWYNLYVNMRYRGVYNVVERMDEEFLQSYTQEPAWDVIKTGNDVLVGENVEWERLHDLVTQNDLAQDAPFEQAAAMVDLESFTSYIILNTWAQNHDWPHNNWYAAR
ncbi:MAG: CotH kinase family protein, partial [Thermoanaerobaculia bacterium]